MEEDEECEGFRVEYEDSSSVRSGAARDGGRRSAAGALRPRRAAPSPLEGLPSSQEDPRPFPAPAPGFPAPEDLLAHARGILEGLQGEEPPGGTPDVAPAAPSTRETGVHAVEGRSESKRPVPPALTRVAAATVTAAPGSPRHEPPPQTPQPGTRSAPAVQPRPPPTTRGGRKRKAPQEHPLYGNPRAGRGRGRSPRQTGSPPGFSIRRPAAPVPPGAPATVAAALRAAAASPAGGAGAGGAGVVGRATAVQRMIEGAGGGWDGGADEVEGGLAAEEDVGRGQAHTPDTAAAPAGGAGAPSAMRHFLRVIGEQAGPSAAPPAPRRARGPARGGGPGSLVQQMRHAIERAGRGDGSPPPAPLPAAPRVRVLSATRALGVWLLACVGESGAAPAEADLGAPGMEPGSAALGELPLGASMAPARPSPGWEGGASWGAEGRGCAVVVLDAVGDAAGVAPGARLELRGPLCVARGEGEDPPVLLALAAVCV